MEEGNYICMMLNFVLGSRGTVRSISMHKCFYLAYFSFKITLFIENYIINMRI